MRMRRKAKKTTVLVDSDEDFEGGAFQDATGKPTVQDEKYISKDQEKRCDMIMQEMCKANPATISSEHDILAAQKKMRQTLREADQEPDVEDEDRELMAAEEESEEKKPKASGRGKGRGRGRGRGNRNKTTEETEETDKEEKTKKRRRGTTEDKADGCSAEKGEEEKVERRKAKTPTTEEVAPVAKEAKTPTTTEEVQGGDKKEEEDVESKSEAPGIRNKDWKRLPSFWDYPDNQLGLTPSPAKETPEQPVMIEDPPCAEESCSEKATPDKKKRKKGGEEAKESPFKKSKKAAEAVVKRQKAKAEGVKRKLDFEEESPKAEKEQKILAARPIVLGGWRHACMHMHE